MEIYDSGIITKTSQLDVVLDRVYASYIRSKGDCVQRGTDSPTKCNGEITNGHVFSRSCSYLKYDERNTWPQCMAHNLMHSIPSNEIYYHDWLKSKLGNDRYETLKKEYKMTMCIAFKINADWYKEKIAHYRALVNL